MYGNNPAPAQLRCTGKSAMRKVGILLRELSDDEDELLPSTMLVDLSEPWLPGFNSYWDSKDHLGEMTIVEWWSVRMIEFEHFQKPHSRLFLSGTALDILSGALLPETSSQSWRHPFPVNGHSHQQGLPSAGATIDSNQMSSRRYSS
jgi:hypothetical protein